MNPLSNMTISSPKQFGFQALGMISLSLSSLFYFYFFSMTLSLELVKLLMTNKHVSVLWKKKN
jgi:hypothetical protein